MRDLGPGRRIGRFVVERKLGQGGMGAVFLVADERGARLALKLIAGEDEDWTRRFEREARAALAIHHEHVARVLPLERHEGLLMLPMELLEGGTLKDVVKARGPLPWREAATLGAAIARGLAAIHAGGFVHRDLKPANVLLDGAGRPKITDFGLVKRASGVSVAPGVLTRTGEILGTFEYLAPELAEGSKVDARADLYSLGATLYELLS
ncbi:MAG TPA: serine/threonine-protein kinase, partial [Planctomycetota bacterium]|nr:serine/threonine-protein kinase [Planctomycetota bacterium]